MNPSGKSNGARALPWQRKYLASIGLFASAFFIISSAAKVLKQEPVAGSLRPGEKVLVDDATCPEGQIKEITGGDAAKRIYRASRCVFNEAPKDPSAKSLPQPEMLKRELELIRLRHNFDTAWLRLEATGPAPIALATGMADAEEPVGIGSVSKSITAIGIALLIQQGKLRLDSRLGDVLASYLMTRRSSLDPSLQSITIERLLTHRAGLPAQAAGVGVGSVSEQDKGSPFFDYYKSAVTKDQVKSNGKDDFVYSNLSYLILGMVIEAVSGEDYSEFCQHNIFGPLGIKGAVIPPYWNVVGPFGGWRMELSDVVKVWSIFDARTPSLLTARTLKVTLLGKLGRPVAPSSNVYYTLGVWVQQDRAGGPYVLYHDGIARFFRDVPNTYFTYIEKSVPGYTWAISASPLPPLGEPLGNLSGEVERDAHLMLKGELH